MGKVDGDLHTTVARRLRRAGQRYTSARRALIDVLVGSQRPLTAAEIGQADRLAPVSTTYRNLATLTQAGVLHRFTEGDCARFELAQDLTEHHHHLVCLSCGHVDDFILPEAAETAVTMALQVAANSGGFRVEGHRLDAHGVCPRCQ
jgi:Fe2+ or Zn2+ uptake regulation protein